MTSGLSLPLTSIDVPVTLFMLSAAAILFIGFLGRVLAKRTLIPYIIWLMLFGVLIGPVFGLTGFATFSSFLPFVSTIVLVLLLFNAGLGLNLHRILKRNSPLLSLSFVNFFLAASLIAFVMYLLGYGLDVSVLIGLMVGSISSVIIPSLKDGDNKNNSNVLANLESVITEPLGIILVLVTLAAIMINGQTIGTLVSALFSEFSIGIVLGAIFGMAWVPIMGYFQRSHYEYSYAASLAIVFLVYTLVQYVNGSGPISALVFGFIIANGEGLYHRFKYRHSITFNLSGESRSFNNLITFFVTSFFFVYFGSLIIINDYYAIFIGVAVALAALIARQIGTWITLRHSVSEEDRYHASFMLSRGSGAAIVASLLFSYNIVARLNLLDMTFSIILFTVFLNGLLLFIFKDAKPSGGKNIKKY